MSAVALDHADAGADPRRTVWHRRLQSFAVDQQGRSFLWAAPALAAGSGLYYGLAGEPGLVLTGMLAGLGLALLWLGRATPLVLLAGVVVLGFTLAKLQSLSAGTRLLAASTGEVAVAGQVIARDRAASGRLVLILAPQQIGSLPQERLPSRLRLSMPQKAVSPGVGDRVSLRARLLPLPSPVEPGGFDYGRSLWLDGIGGTGRVTSPVTTLATESADIANINQFLADIRNAMGARIRAVLAEPYASFAEALITGERSSIPAELNRSLLVSGLYHILSISGLHMWLVAGGVFWAIRAALALVPGLALCCPIRKWAAAAALLMGLFYMLLAEGGVATARSFLMIAVMFFAILVDRPAVSLRSLALSAVVILVLDPAAAVEASFQMSFLAVLGLVAFYEAWSRHRAERQSAGRRLQRHWAWRLAAWAVAAMAASLVTSVIAGFSSGLAAAYHFGRIAPYGVLANGLAVPVVGFLIMPFALLAALLMPLGLERLPLLVMGKGLELLIAISNGVAALPGANEVIARPPLAAVLALGSGVILFCLLAGPVRLAGLPVMVAGAVLLLVPAPRPDLLVEATGQNVALRDQAGRLVPALPRRARFAVEKWLQANGEEAGLTEAANRPGWICAGGRCTASVKGAGVLYLTGREGQAVDCKGFAVVIADFPLRGACREAHLRIDRFDLWRRGAHAVRLGGAAPEVVTARGEQGERPWVVHPEPRKSLQPID